jgi:hypothetical protein
MLKKRLENLKLMRFIQLIMLLLLISCNKDKFCNDNLEKYPNLVTGYSYPVFDATEYFEFYLNYDSKGRITKRIGGFLNYSNPIGFLYFSNNVFDTIIYKKDTIRVRTILNGETNGQFHEYLLGEKIIQLNSNGQYIKSYSDIYSPRYYYYNDKNQISETLDSIISTPENIYVSSAKYFYSENGNLEKIERRLIRDMFSTEVQIDTTYTYYSNFDNASNPFNELQIFNDTFLRSLSKNNFSKYTSLDATGDFTFSYNECGNIIF